MLICDENPNNCGDSGDFMQIPNEIKGKQKRF